jgi:hypothetical protein
MITETLYAWRASQSITHTSQCSPNELLTERWVLSQKREVFEPYCNLQYHRIRVYNACCLPVAQRAL